MAVYCGIDWAEGHHDIALVDGDGMLVARRRISETVDVVMELAAAGDTAADPIPVAIETPRGLLVAVLRATGQPVYPVNPLAVARYRGRTSVSGKKSDHADAMTLANILHTDAHLHRTALADADQAAQAADAAKQARRAAFDHGDRERGRIARRQVTDALNEAAEAYSEAAVSLARAGQAAQAAHTAEKALQRALAASLSKEPKQPSC